MPILQIDYENEEELCRLLRMTLEKLPACENLPSGLGLVRQLRRSSSGLPTVSIIALGDAQIAPPSAVPTFPTGISVDDPDNPFQVLVTPGSFAGVPTLPGLPHPFDDVVTVQDDKGKITVQRKIPTDLFLLEAMQEGGFFGDVIANVSRGLASILGLNQGSISAALAEAGNESIPATHIKLGLPLIGIPVVGSLVSDALLREQNASLLAGDIESLRQSQDAWELMTALALNIPKDVQEIGDRITGNLEILRIEQQEEF